MVERGTTRGRGQHAEWFQIVVLEPATKGLVRNKSFQSRRMSAGGQGVLEGAMLCVL